jgi:hypothetical protein
MGASASASAIGGIISEHEKVHLEVAVDGDTILMLRWL